MQKWFLLTRLQCLLRDPFYEFILFDLVSRVFLSLTVEFDVNDIHIFLYIRTRFAEIYWYNNNDNNNNNNHLNPWLR